MFTFDLGILNMNWHTRFKAMKTALGYTNADIAKITGNTPDSIKTATQPNNELPRWLRLAIVVYESTLKTDQTLEALKKQDRGGIEAFIRKRLAFDDSLIAQLRYTDKSEIGKEHRRFEMSGYENKRGQSVISNQAILNEFADLGIYDYTNYLFLDFYKGNGTLYFRYFGSHMDEQIELSGYGTVDIIYQIFEKTIFSNKGERRRI